MRMVILGCALAALSAVALAQAPSSTRAAATSVARPTGTLAQVMRGIYFPNANIIFDVQHNDPGVPKKKSGETTSGATDTYANTYTGWETVENAAVALT